MANERDIKEIVDDFQAWTGNAYTLAMLIFRKTRDDDVAVVESLGLPEAAEALRSQ